MTLHRLSHGLAVLVAGLALSGCGNPEPGSVPGPTAASTAGELSAITQADGLYVAVGGLPDPASVNVPSTSVIVTSSDGETWTRVALDAQGDLYQVAHGNGLFLAVGGDLVPRTDYGFDPLSVVLTSTDGVAWSKVASPTSAPLRSLAFGNGLFVAMSDDGKAYSTSDGTLWTSASTGAGADLGYDLAFGNGHFVMTSGAMTVATSTDALTWSSATGPTTDPSQSISFANGAFFANVVGLCEDQGCTPFQGLSRSDDGTSWGTFIETADEVTHLTYDHGVYVGVTILGISVSSDGASWSPASLPVAGVWSQVAAGPAGFVVVGSGILTSTDGVSWSQSEIPSP